MVYLKACLFGCIGIVIACVLRVLWGFVSSMPHSQDVIFIVELDTLFLLLAVACVGLGGYLAVR